MTLPPPTTHHPHQLVLSTERVVDDEDDDWCFVDFGDILQDPPQPPSASHSDSRPTSPTQHDASDEDLVLPIASHSNSRPTSPTQHDASDEDLVLPIASHSDSRPTSPTQHDASDEDLVFCNEYFEDVVVGLRKATDQQQKQTPLIEILVTEVDLSEEQTCKPESRFLNSMEGAPCGYSFDVYDEMEDEDDSLLPSDSLGSKYCFLNHDVVDFWGKKKDFLGSRQRRRRSQTVPRSYV